MIANVKEIKKKKKDYYMKTILCNVFKTNPYDVYQGHFKKPLKSHRKAIKKSCLRRVRTFFMGRLIFSYF